jgi:hypothetical protein
MTEIRMDPMRMKAVATGFSLALCLACAGAAQAAAPAAIPEDPLALAARIQKEVVDLRGLTFKQPVSMQKQTAEGLGQLMDKEMAEAVPSAVSDHFDKIVRRLGLYRGPEIKDYKSLMRTVITSQVAAYYDPDTKRVYLLSEGDSSLEQGVIMAHELYHALQDQYFDLNSYMSEKLNLNSDEEMARNALVEGEATYIHTLWGFRQMMGGALPPRALIAPAIQMQANLSMSDLRQMVGGSPEDAAEIDAIPPFILEVMMGNYLKGAGFVFAVQEQGWAAVEKLYKEYPPQSTEQILHPEKWVARENPTKFSWLDLSKERTLRDWELLDDDVVGEIQWRIIFNEHGLKAEADAAAGGWDGDRYAVLKRKGSDETLLLLRASWDSEAEAGQFADAYRRLLAVKYEKTGDPVLVEQQGQEVFVVEGGRKADHEAMMKIIKQAKKSRA